MNRKVSYDNVFIFSAQIEKEFQNHFKSHRLQGFETSILSFHDVQ